MSPQELQAFAMSGCHASRSNYVPIVTITARGSRIHIISTPAYAGRILHSCAKILQPANSFAHPLQMQHKPLSQTQAPSKPRFNGTTFGIWLLHQDLEQLVPIFKSSNQQNLPPNFLGSHRLLSATSSVRSY